MSRYRLIDTLLISAFSMAVAFQLFIPPSVGMANNGDFAKMIGRFGLAPEHDAESSELSYFTPRWIYDRSHLWVSDNRSSELMLIGAAMLIGWQLSSAVFDIRILGAINALLWISCFAALLFLLPSRGGWRRYLAALVAMLIFTDVSYVAHFNSFYTDTAAFLFLAWAVLLWLFIGLRERPSLSIFMLFSAAAILCATSKPQHSPLGFFLFILAAMAAFSFDGTRRKLGALALASLIPLAAIFSFLLAPPRERKDAQCLVIFEKILKKSPAPQQEARELGLGPEYMRYLDASSWRRSNVLLNDPSFEVDFGRRTGHARLTQFYLRHPWRTLNILYRDLKVAAYHRRPQNIGNYEKQGGVAPGTLAKSFGWWSALRSEFFRLAPWHILAWYAAVLGGGTWVAIRNRTTTLSRVALLCVLLAGMGLTELAITSLADAGEDERHLFLFHVITDFTILLAVVWAVEKWTLRAVPVSAPVPETAAPRAALQKPVQS